MSDSAAGLLTAAQATADADAHQNTLVPMIESGRAPLATLAALGAEERLIVPSDRRSFLLLADRAQEPATGDFFAWLAGGESVALDLLPAFTAAAGMTEAAFAGYRPRPGCQSYPAYLAWLALNADPLDVVLALCVNFAAWGGYCGTVAQALRGRYRFPDEACAFFDFFAEPGTELQDRALAAIEAGLAEGRLMDGQADGQAAATAGSRADGYIRLLQSYEASFWNTLAVTGWPAGTN
jgi:hypothetical protein